MRKNRILKKANICMLMAVMLLLGILISCEKEVGPPVIKSIRLTDPATAGQNLIGASLESWIVIQGENFIDVQKVIINDVEVFVNSAYVSENNIVMQIPVEVPNMGTDPELEGKIEIITEYGSIIYDFDVFAPPAITNYISSEFANAGDVITLTGKYFFLVQNITFPGGILGTDIVSADDGSWCTVKVPEGVEEGGPLLIETLSGVSESNAGVTFNDTMGIVCNFDDKNTWDGWGGTLVSTDGHAVLPSFMDSAMYCFSEVIAPGSWWVDPFAIPMSTGEYPQFTDKKLAKNLAVKFEYYFTGAWNSGYFRFNLVQVDSVWNEEQGQKVLDWYNVYEGLFQPWTDVDDPDEFMIDVWRTAVIPLDEFNLTKEDGVDYTGDTRSLASFKNIKNFNFMGMYFVNPDWGVPLQNFSMGIDNVRIVAYEP